MGCISLLLKCLIYLSRLWQLYIHVIAAYCKLFLFHTVTSDFASIAHYMLVLLSAQFLNLWRMFNLFCFRGENKDIYRYIYQSIAGVNKHSTGPTGPHRAPPRPTGPHRDPPGPTGTYQAPPRPTRHPSEALLADSNPVQQGLKLGNRALQDKTRPGPHWTPPD